MSKWDLTRVMTPYMDLHLVFPMLEFLTTQKLYDLNDLVKFKFEVLKKTNMVDYTGDIHAEIYGQDIPLPEDIAQKRADVLKDLNTLMLECNPILKRLSSEEFMNKLESMRDHKSLSAYLREVNFEMNLMESMHKLSKHKYECGMYQHANHYLYFYLLIMPSSDKNYLSVLWGKLASEIQLGNMESSMDDFNRLREYIDGYAFNSPLQLLQQRTWLIHWGLFIYLGHSKGKDLIIDVFLYRPNYLNAIQTMCPHVLRYLAAAVIVNRSRRSALKDLVKVIQQESYTYRDPITEFLEHLYVNFDFEGARQKLHECQLIIASDFFLNTVIDDFVENARLMIFETFCRIHQCISIGMLAEKLNMNPTEAECWIVNLIRNARLDAKIDSKLGHVVMGTQPSSPYQQLLEKVDSLSVRSEALQALIDRKLKAKSQELPRGYNQDFINN